MIDSGQLIKLINKNCKSFFQNSYFNLKLHTRSFKSYFYKVEGTSFAINRYKNNPERVKVLHWFEDFWVFVEVKFIDSSTFISMSVFQGNEDDEGKHQLFRAEWDDHNNPDEKHPQPHWHIIYNYTIEESFKEFSETMDEGSSFSTFEVIKSQIVDVHNMHFAMNGNWQSGENHIHYINDEEKIVRWFQGVLLHLRTELEDAK